MRKNKIIIGIDQSISATGVVVLDSGTIRDHTIIQVPNDLKKLGVWLNDLNPIWVRQTRAFKAGLVDENWKRLKKAKDLTKEEKELFKVPQPLRLHIISSIIDEIVTTYCPSMVGMEEPAFGASGQLASLGSLLGQIQGVMFNQAVPYQTINIARIKVFATGKGNALKETMIAAIPDEHRYIIDQYDDKIVDNIADAYWIARYMQSEVAEEDITYDVNMTHLLEVE